MKTLFKLCAMAMTMLVANFSSTTASAAENPMESAGIEHNLYLECLSLSKDQTASPLKRLVEDCGYDPGMPTDEFVQKYHYLVSIDPTTTLAEHLEPLTVQFTEYERSFFHRINKVVATSSSLEEANAKFAELEREAIEKLSTKTAGGRAVLAAFSTIRHSVDYWSNESGLRRPWWAWVVIAVVDGVVTALTTPGLGAAASEFASEIISHIWP